MSMCLLQYAGSGFAETQLNLGNESSLVGEAVDRFGGRDAQKFKFLGKYVMCIPNLSFLSGLTIRALVTQPLIYLVCKVSRKMLLFLLCQ